MHILHSFCHIVEYIIFLMIKIFDKFLKALSLNVLCSMFAISISKRETQYNNPPGTLSKGVPSCHKSVHWQTIIDRE